MEVEDFHVFHSLVKLAFLVVDLAGATGACHHAQLIFVFLGETVFCHIGEAGLKLLTSGNPSASADLRCFTLFSLLEC